MHPIACGPKFVADLAFKACSRAVESLTFPTLFYIMKPLSLHKNADTVNKSNIIASMSTLKFIEDESQTAGNIKEIIIRCIGDIVSFFGVGLSSKRTEGRQHCRKALTAVKKVVGADKFEESINSISGATIQSVIRKEILRTSNKSTSFSQQSMEDGNSFSLKRRKLGLSSSRVKESSSTYSTDKNKSRLTEIFSKAAIDFEEDDIGGGGRGNRNEQGTREASEIVNGTASIAATSAVSIKKRSGAAAIVNIGYDQNDNDGFNSISL